MDESTFRRFYDRTVRPLHAYLCRLSRDAALAEDVAQESYLRFLKSNQLDGSEARMKAYLFRIATNLFLDAWRRRQREARFAQSYAKSEEVAGNSVLRGDMEAALERLRPVERAMLWLAYVGGFEHREIARILKVKEKGIRVTLYRCRKKMARMLQRAGAVGEMRDGQARL